MAPPIFCCFTEGYGVRGRKWCWTGWCLRLCTPCFGHAPNVKEPLVNFDNRHAVGHEKEPVNDNRQVDGREERPLNDSHDDSHSKAEQFMLKEKEMPPLSLRDLKNLLNHITAQVEIRKESKKNETVMEDLVSQYVERKESLNLFITSLPSDLRKKVVGGSKDVLLPLLTKALGGAGNVQWIGLGLRLIAWTLDNIHDTMKNSQESLEVLQVAIDLMQKTKEIWEISCRNYEDATNPNLQKIIEIAFRCAITCTYNMSNTTMVRFFNAQHIKETMANLKKELRDAKDDTSHYMLTEIFRHDSSVDTQEIFANVYDYDKVGGGEGMRLAMEFLRKDCSEMSALCLHGMAGIGKSFLGLEIFKQFQASKSIQQESPYKACRVELEFGIEDKNLVGIQKQILHKLFGCDASNVYDCLEGREKLTKELKRISDPIFLYLDNVLEDQHLVEIVPKSTCFPRGSKLLVTSRGANIERGVKGLNINDFKLVEIKKMKDEEARELLWRQINDEEKCKVVSNSGSLKELEEEVVNLCGGLPLALKVVGGYIGSDERGPTDVGVWEEVVNAMKKAQPLSGEAHDELYARIEFSIESLDANVKSAFLDIASFYDTGTSEWELVERLVRDRHHLRILKQRGLVQKTQKNDLGESSLIIEVHDVLLALARRMINDDTHELRITGQDDFIRHSGNLEKVVALKDVKLEAHMLRQMPRLRFLKDVEVRGECEEAAQLRHLSVVCALSSKMGKLLNLEDCACLKHVSWRDAEKNASDLEFLRHPKLSNALEVLDLLAWKNLNNVDVIQTLRSLRGLALQRCHEISCLPQGIGSLTNLKWMSLWGCGKLEALPEGVASLTGLETLDLGLCRGLQTLPVGIGSLTRLTDLCLVKCNALKCLPDGISRLESLTVLNLEKCSSLVCLPEGVTALKSLTRLKMRGCSNLGFLPEGIAGMTSLVELDLARCSSLKSLPEELACLTCLARLTLSECDGLQNIHQRVLLPASLTYLDLSKCKTLESIEAVTTLTRLTEIDLSSCTGLQMLPAGFSRLNASLTSLNLAGTSLNSNFHEIENFTGLKSFTLSDCESLYSLMEEGKFSVLGMVTEPLQVSWSRCRPYLPESLTSFTSLKELTFEGRGVNLPLFPQELTSLTGLKVLSIKNCKSVQSLPPGFTSLRNLERLFWRDCESLQSLQELAGLTSLRRVDLTGCASGEHSMLKEIWTLTGLSDLGLEGWENLRALPDGMASLTRLQWLNLRGCTGLLSLPAEISGLRPDLQVCLEGCTKLQT